MSKPKVHVTDVHQFMTCRTKWFYASQLSHGLRPSRPNKHLLLGSAVHHALGAYYGAGPSVTDWAVDGAVDAYDAFIAREIESGLEVDENIGEAIELGREMVENYVPWSQKYDRFTVLMPEVELAYDFGDFEFAGTCDGVVKDDQDRLWLLEHKTAAQFPNETALAFSLQASMYTLVAGKTEAISELGPVTGVIYNILLKKVPTLPKVLPSGKGVERRSNICCTPDQYLRAVALAGFNPRDYQEFASTLDPYKLVKRAYIVLPEESLFQALDEFKTVARIMLNNPDIYRCDPLRSCSWCDYRSLCNQRLFGMPWDELADLDFVKETDGSEVDAEDM